MNSPLPKEKSIFWTHHDQEKAKIRYIRVLLVFQKRLDFLQAKEWFFLCFFRPCILGTFCRFIPCNLSCLREWHAHRIAGEAQGSEGYGRNDTTYKSLRYVSRVLEDTGRRTIHAVRTPKRGLTIIPDAVLQAVLDSFQAQHGDALPDLEPETRSTLREHVPKVSKREKRRTIEPDPFQHLRTATCPRLPKKRGRTRR